MKPREVAFIQGARVRFVPRYAKYSHLELIFDGQTGTVKDVSDLPTVQMDTAGTVNGWQTHDLLVADQRDLEPVELELCP